MNKLRKIILIGILITTTTFYGQRRPDREKIKTLKVAFITERLDLSSSEAETFWPAYNAHQKQMNSFRKTCKDLGIPAIVFEGGESIRLCGDAIDHGIGGIKNVLKALGMAEFDNLKSTI